MRRLLAALLPAGLVAAAHAAGGHHAVDDAVILEAGQCELEAWVLRTREPERAPHAGLGCRVGPVELGVGLDASRTPADRVRVRSLQLKWAAPVAEALSVGAVVAPFHQSGTTGQSGTTVLLLATATQGDWLAHVNLGRDFLRGAPGHARGGVSLEWQPAPGWTATAERYLEGGAHFARIGARWQATPAWSFDLSRTQPLRGGGSPGWTLGSTFAFAR